MGIGQQQGVCAIDFQQLFMAPSSAAYLPAWSAACRPAFKVVDTALYDQMPVVFTRHAVRPEELPHCESRQFERPLMDCTEEANLVHEAQQRIPPASEFRKWCFDASHSGFLAQFPEVRRWYLVGIMTHRCVLATALGLARLGLEAVVVHDACCARNAEDHEAALRVLSAGHANVLGSRQAVEMLRRGLT